MKLSLLLIYLLIPTISFCQTKIYNDSIITDILKYRLESINERIIKAIIEGKLKVYRTDALKDTTNLIRYYSQTNQLKKSQNLVLVFRNFNSVESSIRTSKIVSIEPDSHFGQMFNVAFSDLDNIISTNDKKLLIILSNLLYSVSEFGEERIVNDNSLNQNFRVFLTEKNLKLISNQLLSEYAEAFHKTIIIKDSIKRNLNGIYEDTSLNKEFTQESWRNKNEFAFHWEQESNDPTSFPEDSIIYIFDPFEETKIVLNTKSIGLSYKFTEEKDKNRIATLFISRNNRNFELPSWLKFILDNYL